MEKRFFYNIDNKHIDIFSYSHVEYYHNHREVYTKPFDYYLRGIIKDNILYLRVFYPYNNIDYLSNSELIKKSFDLLTLFKKDVMLQLSKHDIKIKDIKLNVTNEALKHFLNTQYV